MIPRSGNFLVDMFDDRLEEDEQFAKEKSRVVIDEDE